MNEFTPSEIEGIVKAISQPPLSKERGGKIPLLPPGSYGTISKVGFTPIEGKKARPLAELTEKDLLDLESLKAKVEVVFGRVTLTIKELASLKVGSLLPLEELCDDLVDVYVNGSKIGRGEVVAVDGQFGVKIVSFTQKP